MPRIKLRPHKVYMTDEEYERVRAKAAHAGCDFSYLPVKKQFIEWEEKAWQLLP